MNLKLCILGLYSVSSIQSSSLRSGLHRILPGYGGRLQSLIEAQKQAATLPEVPCNDRPYQAPILGQVLGEYRAKRFLVGKAECLKII